MYICQHFIIHELVPKAIFERFGVQAWQFLNPSALQALDGLREFFDRTITVNDYAWGGKNQFRGFRPRSCDIGAEYSQHRLGNAFDCTIKGISAEEARKQILAHGNDPRLQLINCIEAEVSWLHFDCRNIPDRIRVIKP